MNVDAASVHISGAVWREKHLGQLFHYLRSACSRPGSHPSLRSGPQLLSQLDSRQHQLKDKLWHPHTVHRKLEVKKNWCISYFFLTLIFCFVCSRGSASNLRFLLKINNNALEGATTWQCLSPNFNELTLQSLDVLSWIQTLRIQYYKLLTKKR